MEMIIGRQGDQKMVITEKTVSRRHCKVVLLENGRASVENLSPNGTYFDGERKDQAVVSVDTEIGLGPFFKARLSDLIETDKPQPSKKPASNDTKAPKSSQVDLNPARKYIHYRQVIKDYKRIGDLESFRTVIDNSADQLPLHVPYVVQTALANKYLRNGKIAKAQELLYSAGDRLFADLEQNRTPEMEGTYASMMSLLSEVYQAMYKQEEAETAGRYAVGIYNRWKPGDPGISADVVADAYCVYADALVGNGNNAKAVICSNKALDLYRKAGSGDVAYFSAKISETEDKIKSASSKGRTSIGASFPYCATYMYWCGNVEPNPICTLVYYDPNERALCTKTFRGSTNGMPATQSCNNWEQRFR